MVGNLELRFNYYIYHLNGKTCQSISSLLYGMEKPFRKVVGTIIIFEQIEKFFLFNMMQIIRVVLWFVLINKPLIASVWWYL